MILKFCFIHTVIIYSLSDRFKFAYARATILH